MTRPAVVYVFLDEKNKPYYVGKTISFKKRRRQHVREIKNGNTTYKYNKARSLIARGYKFRMRTIAKFNSEEEALDAEKYYIKKYRSQGIQLTNLTDGGEAGGNGLVKKKPAVKKVVKKKKVIKKRKKPTLSKSTIIAELKSYLKKTKPIKNKRKKKRKLRDSKNRNRG